jgi:hypothetical protein
MKEINKSLQRSILTAFLAVVLFFKVSGQEIMPDILIKSTLKEQLNYLEERTRIYENYRAIREDMFQKVKRNITDTLLAENVRINLLNGTISVLNHTIDSLRSDLKMTKAGLENATRTKNSIRILGAEVNKLTYNSLMWLIIIGLATILVMGSMVFKRNLSVTHSIKKELGELRDEFQVYRKTAREAREKMSMDHFNELKKMKGG